MLPERIVYEVYPVSDLQLHFSHLVDSNSELPGFLLEILPECHKQPFIKDFMHIQYFCWQKLIFVSKSISSYGKSSRDHSKWQWKNYLFDSDLKMGDQQAYAITVSKQTPKDLFPTKSGQVDEY